MQRLRRVLSYWRSERASVQRFDRRPGLAIRLIIEAAVLIAVSFNAGLLVDHAVRHSSIVTRGSNFVYDSGVVHYGDAVWALLLGPVVQAVVIAALYAALRRRPRDQAWRVATWVLLGGVDLALGLLFVASTPPI